MTALTKSGQQYVSQWIDDNGVPGLNLEAFYNYAEDAFDNSHPTEDVIIELGKRHSLTGNPVTLNIPRNYFRE